MMSDILIQSLSSLLSLTTTRMCVPLAQTHACIAHSVLSKETSDPQPLHVWESLEKIRLVLYSLFSSTHKVLLTFATFVQS